VLQCIAVGDLQCIAVGDLQCIAVGDLQCIAVGGLQCIAVLCTVYLVPRWRTRSYGIKCVLQLLQC